MQSRRFLYLVMTFIFALMSLSAPVSASNRIAGVTFGIGSWYSDAFRSSFIWGGGVFVRPGVRWLEIAAAYDRALLRVPSTDPLKSDLDEKYLGMVRGLVYLPSDLVVFGIPATIFPVFGYVYTHLGDHGTHGFDVGGGLEFRCCGDHLGLRAEVFDQIYKVPTSSGGSTDEQSDLFFLARVVLAI